MVLVALVIACSGSSVKLDPGSESSPEETGTPPACDYRPNVEFDGVVRDADGRGVWEATVTIREAASGVVHTIPAEPGGTYAARVGDTTEGPAVTFQLSAVDEEDGCTTGEDVEVEATPCSSHAVDLVVDVCG